MKRFLFVVSLCLIAAPVLWAQGTPPVPSNVTATIVPGPMVDVTWEAQTGVWGFRIYRSVTDDQHFLNIGSAGPLIRKISDGNVVPGSTYFYRVTSINTLTLIESAPSNIAHIAIPINQNLGVIRGTVTDEASGQPIKNITLQFMSTTAPEWVQILSDQAGYYETTLKPDTYLIKAQPSPLSPYIAEYYNNILNQANATPVPVTGGSATTINFALAKSGPAPSPAGTVSGRVTDEASGRPIPNVAIQFMPATSGVTQVTVYTNRAGYYQAALAPATYVIKAEPPLASDYIAEFYNNASSQGRATPVPVTEGSTKTIDFALASKNPSPQTKGTISGTVTDEADHQPIPNVTIRFFPAPGTTGGRVSAASTDAAGHYSVMLDPGTYVLRADQLEARNARGGEYQGEWYDDATDRTDATPVMVTAGSTATANFALAKILIRATVRGTVTDAEGNPLPQAMVMFMSAQRDLTSLAGVFDAVPNTLVDEVDCCAGVAWRGWTDSEGHYAASIPAGASYAVMAAKSGYLPEFYSQKSTLSQADILTADHDLSGIDFSLAQVANSNNSVSGKVQDAAGNGVPSRIVLIPIQQQVVYTGVRFGTTDSSGAFTMEGIAAGSYLILAIPYRDYAPAFYKEGAIGISNWTEAGVVVIQGTISGIKIGVVPLHAPRPE